MIKPLNEISPKPPNRYPTGLGKLDLLLGGGIVRGSTTLLAGTTGAGKSTLLIQVADFLTKHSKLKILYVCGEENQEQVKMRAKRLNINSKHILISENVGIEQVLLAVRRHEPDLVIIDSLQMLHTQKLKTAPGSPSQMKHGLMTLCKMAKHLNISVIFIGHATKGGYVAGLQTLQHMVDTVMYLHLDEENNRSIVARKNRFGTSGEAQQIFMDENGITDLEIAPDNQLNIKLNNNQLEAILKDHPIWNILVRQSLSWLGNQIEEDYGSST